MVDISGGDGSSLEEAIIISNCDDVEGVDQEYLEIRRLYGHFKMLKQSLLNTKGRVYDQIELQVEGEIKVMFFDITDFFGKRYDFQDY